MTGRVDRRAAYRVFTHARRLDELAALRAMRAELDASEVELLAVIDEDPDPLDKDFNYEEVACVLQVSSARAAELVLVATRLVDQFPNTVQAMHAGELPGYYADKLARQTAGLADAVCAAVEKTVLAKAARQTSGQFGTSLRKAISKYDTRAIEKRHELARTTRGIWWGKPDADGMTDNNLRLPADEQARLRARVDVVADGWKGLDNRYADERRADALCALAGGTAGSVRTNVSVVVSMSSLLGADDAPGELNGHPIPATLARAMAHGENATWRRLVTDPLGQIRDITATTYTPPAAMARFVQLRDPRCVFPTCNQPSTRCELDHTRAWATGGETCSANLMPLCARHHHLKHDGNWGLKRLDDGTVRWRSPAGATYDKPPPDPLPIDTTADPPPF